LLPHRQAYIRILHDGKDTGMQMWMMMITMIMIMMKMIMIIKMAMMVPFMAMLVGDDGDGYVLVMLIIY
jgi:hypothetical protein